MKVAAIPVALRYEELSGGDIERWMVDDINTLVLPHVPPGSPPIPGNWLQRIVAEGSHLFVAIKPGRIIGFALVTKAYLLFGREDRIESLCVAEDHSFQEVAKELLDRIEATSRQEASVIIATPGPRKLSVHYFFESRGYVANEDGTLRLGTLRRAL